MSEQATDYPLTVWASPWSQPVALRYERASEMAPWLITGMVVADALGIGAAWFKAFQWRRLGNPLDAVAHGGYVWEYEPTAEDVAWKWHTDGENPRTHPRIYYMRDGDPRAPRREVAAQQRAAESEVIEALVAKARRRHLSTASPAEHAGKQSPEGSDHDPLQRVVAGKRYELSDDHYREVAEAYRLALAVTGKPTSHVATTYDVPYATAANWVRAARARGFLPPTTKGRTS